MKLFLLGCGAQKAGTTWLAKNLDSSPEYWNRGIKEWRFWQHYFDNDSRLSQLRKMEKKLHDEPSSKRRVGKAKLNWRVSALQSPDLFLQETVDDFVAKAHVKVLGDMTPLNGALSIDEFTFIKEYFGERNIVVKPLLIMRDPFERIWSAVRMNVRNQHPDDQDNEQFLCRELLKAYRLNLVEKRTRYEQTIENLEHVFDEQDICYEFSENLFSQDGLDRVTRHLGMSSLMVDSRSPNPTPKLTAVPIEVRHEIISFYKDTYLSTLDKFGDEVKAFWAESFKLL